MHAPILTPSILAGDHANLAASAAIVEQLGLKWIHLDIMDGHFVPNLSFGPQTVAALRKNSKLFFDVHLMLSEPHRYIEAFAKAGANLISIHIEPEYDHAATLTVSLSRLSRAVATARPDDTGLARKFEVTIHTLCTLRDNRTGAALFENRSIDAMRQLFTTPSPTVNESDQLQAEYNLMPHLASALADRVAHTVLDVW